MGTPSVTPRLPTPAAYAWAVRRLAHLAGEDHLQVLERDQGRSLAIRVWGQTPNGQPRTRALILCTGECWHADGVSCDEAGPTRHQRYDLNTDPQGAASVEQFCNDWQTEAPSDAA